MTFEIRNLAAGYPGRAVLPDVSTAPVQRGQLVALLGPNGAGKSTLLRAIAGLLPVSGQVLLDGVDLVRLSPRERASHVGFVPQGLPRDAALSVLETAVIGLRIIRPRLTSDDAASAALAALDHLGGRHLALEPMGRLSGGQRQIAAIAGAIAADQPLLLLDEPTSALDVAHQFRVMRLLRKLAREGRWIIVVMHDIDMASEWADRLIVMDKGRNAGEGAAADVLTPDLLRRVWGVEAEFTGTPPRIRVFGLKVET
jgi:iron complex transport system ATP-binding protein